MNSKQIREAPTITPCVTDVLPHSSKRTGLVSAESLESLVLLQKVAQLSVTLISHFNFERCIHLQWGLLTHRPTAEMGVRTALATSCSSL